MVFPAVDGNLADEPISKKLRQGRVAAIEQPGSSGLNSTISQDILSELLCGLLIIMKRLPSHVYTSWDIKKFVQFNLTDFSKEIRW